MGLFRPLNDKRVAGTNYLKIIDRSVGYLQGGYYTGAIPGNRNSGNPAGSTYPPAGINRGAESAWSHVQSFSGITQVGKIVYDTGYARRYFAGVTGNYAGYISINNNYDFQKFSYFTAATSQSFSTVNANNCTAVDLNHYTQAWILETTTPEATSAEITNFVKVFLSTETPVDNGKIGAGAIGTSRQALNN